MVEAGVLTNLPYANASFDLVFSADVLEHIQPAEADAVVSELVRVARRHLFLSISLKPHTKARRRLQRPPCYLVTTTVMSCAAQRPPSCESARTT